ncbi:MAG: undecaprenyl-diphosphatase UppP [Calditrichaeota bacterium]|nr:undecaprenyl-diphosphatase UppP [Calditrichota bacterium]
MTLTQSIILGLIQGLTEFLPVSSSGHLVLAEAILHIQKQGITFEVFVHFGTLLAVVVAFWSDIVAMFQAALRWIAHPGQTGHLWKTDKGFRLLILLVIGTIPAGIIGVLFDKTIESAFSEPRFVSIMLLITGVILLLSRFGKTRRSTPTTSDSILIGSAQAFAIIPGISRSGSTISAAMLLGLEKNEAARFSFLLAVPAIFGAFVLKLKDLLAGPAIPHAEVLSLGIGTLVSFISGYFAIILLLDLVKRGKFSWFAVYCFALGLFGLIYFM